MPFSHFHRVLEERLDQEIERRALSLAEGACQSFEVYKYQAGFIAGLKAAIELGRVIESED